MLSPIKTSTIIYQLLLNNIFDIKRKELIIFFCYILDFNHNFNNIEFGLNTFFWKYYDLFKKHYFQLIFDTLFVMSNCKLSKLQSVNCKCRIYKIRTGFVKKQEVNQHRNEAEINHYQVFCFRHGIPDCTSHFY